MQAAYHIIELYLSIGACFFVLSHKKRKKAFGTLEKDILYLKKKWYCRKFIEIWNIYCARIFFFCDYLSYDLLREAKKQISYKNWEFIFNDHFDKYFHYRQWDNILDKIFLLQPF
jgi:hypothetical protein